MSPASYCSLVDHCLFKMLSEITDSYIVRYERSLTTILMKQSIGACKPPSPPKGYMASASLGPNSFIDFKTKDGIMSTKYTTKVKDKSKRINSFD